MLLVGPAFWDTGIKTILHVENYAALESVPNIGLNVAFMMFGLLGLIFNIATRSELLNIML